MSLLKEYSYAASGWTLGAIFSPGWQFFRVAWELSPLGLFLAIPFLLVWIERTEYIKAAKPWAWSWSLLRLTVWKTEFRLDLDLNVWGIGVSCIELNDCAIYMGPLSVQIETDKMYDVDFPPGVPTLRGFFPADRSVKPWPPRCDCDPSGSGADGSSDIDDADLPV